MDRNSGRRLVEFLLIISTFTLIFQTSASNLTLVSRDSSTNSELFTNSSWPIGALSNNSSLKSVLSNNSSPKSVLSNNSSPKSVFANNSSSSISVFSNNNSASEVPNFNNTFAYIDEEIKLPAQPKNQSSPDSKKLSFDEIFKTKRKCCPLDKVFDGFDCFTAVCADIIPDDNPSLINFERHNDGIHVSGDALQSSAPFHCSGQLQQYTNLSIWSNGSIHFFENDELFVVPENVVYCLEIIYPEDSLVMFRCDFIGPRHQPLAYKIIRIISSIFLAGFIVVYMMKPKLHTLHNRCLMRLMICLLGKCVLSIIFHIKYGNCWIQYCTACGIYFFYMGSFCWSTVICYDIWSGIRMKSTAKNVVPRQSIQKKIRNYSKYGWGIASTILFIAIFIDIYTAIFDSSWLGRILIAPEFAIHGNNWMGSNKSMYVYFYGPLITLNVINLIFFLLTIRTIIQVKNDNNNVFKRSECSRRHVQAEMKWFIVFAKLYLVMGITWILDIVSFELSDHNHEERVSKIVVYFVDIFNICQGVMIFFITIITRETARTLSKTFSVTFMKARDSLTNSKKATIVADSNTNECNDVGNRAISQERSTSPV